MNAEKIKIGITGQTGFIGSHLFSYMRVKEDLNLIYCDKYIFDDQSKLLEFVKKCDVIIHAAGMSRHSDSDYLYKNNLFIDKMLATCIKETKKKLTLLYASTIHENRDTPYHKSKRDGHIIFRKLAEESGILYSALVMPNLFGQYSKPFFNSVVSTFCYQVANGIEAKIINDSEIELMFIGEMCKNIYNFLKIDNLKEKTVFPDYKIIKVSQVLELLKYFYTSEKVGVIPEMKNDFELDLFTTFKSYSILKRFEF